MYSTINSTTGLLNSFHNYEWLYFRCHLKKKKLLSRVRSCDAVAFFFFHQIVNFSTKSSLVNQKLFYS